MIVHDVKQGSAAWLALRRGIPTASRFHEIYQPVRRRISARAHLYHLELLDEFIHGVREDPFQNHWTRRGQELEALARFDYAMRYGVKVEEVGFVTRDDGLCGGSPDGLVGSDVLLEIKIHSPQIHPLRQAGENPSHHIGQCQALMYLTERSTAHLYCYSPTEESVLRVIERDDDYLAGLVPVLDQFIAELEEAKEAHRHVSLAGAIP